MAALSIPSIFAILVASLDAQLGQSTLNSILEFHIFLLLQLFFDVLERLLDYISHMIIRELVKDVFANFTILNKLILSKSGNYALLLHYNEGKSAKAHHE